MQNRHDFRLYFTTQHGLIQRFNIPHANRSADGEAVANAMRGFIDSGVVETARGNPISKLNAQLVTTERKYFDI
jgi:hypothetical protein